MVTGVENSIEKPVDLPLNDTNSSTPVDNAYATGLLARRYATVYIEVCHTKRLSVPFKYLSMQQSSLGIYQLGQASDLQ